MRGGAVGFDDWGSRRARLVRFRFTHDSVPNHATKYKGPELLRQVRTARDAVFSHLVECHRILRVLVEATPSFLNGTRGAAMAEQA